MLTLYYKPTCSYSQRVLGEAEKLGVQLDLKDISTDKTLEQELFEKGGKRQVPYLEDEEKGVSMYESGEIVSYLQENYAESGQKKSFDGVHVHKSDDTCSTCQ